MEDGGSAFPRVSHTIDVEDGMSLRDYFAAKAMQAIIANPAPVTIEGSPSASTAEMAYTLADRMLRARAREGKG